MIVANVYIRFTVVVLPLEPVTPTIGNFANQLANSISLIIKISFVLALDYFLGNITPGDKIHNCELYILSEYSPVSTTTPSSSSSFL